MKANAPEKIYLQEPTKIRTEKKYDNDVEYIRTDAFISKATEYLEGHNPFINGDILNTWLDNFKKTMKGE